MKLPLSTILSLAALLPSIFPSAVDNNNKNNVSSDKVTFADLPMELKEMIFFYAPDAYDSFIRAFPKEEGCPRIEMNRLILTISKDVPTWRTVNEAAHMALRLASPVHLKPENPSSILKWLRYFQARSKTVKYFERALYYFAKSDHFSEWYSRWSKEEKKEFGLHMALALILAGKIDEALGIKDLKSLEIGLHRLHNNGNFFWSKDPLAAILFSACLRDDPAFLGKILKQLPKFRRKLDPIDDILRFAVRAKARRIINEYKNILAKASYLNNNSIILDAIKTKDDEFFIQIFHLCRQSKTFGVMLAFDNALKWGLKKPSTLSIILDQVDFSCLKEDEISSHFSRAIKDESLNGYLMLFDRIKKLDAEVMNRIAPELVEYALCVKNEYFIKHLATAGGVPHNDIVRILENLPAVCRKRIPLEYLLTIVDGELPITGSYDFLENRLITFLIEGYSYNGCKIAFSKNSQGERKHPFVKVTPKHVPLAMEKCPLCLLHFPTNLVNDHIEKNPKCFTENAKVFVVLTSALDGKPQFSAMNKYFNVDYLQKIAMDEQSNEFELLVNPCNARDFHVTPLMRDDWGKKLRVCLGCWSLLLN